MSIFFCCLVAQSCPILCKHMDHSPPGSSIHGISQVRKLKWVAISFFRGSSWPRDQIWVSCLGRWILYHWATRKALYPVIKTTVSACISVRQCLYLKVSSFSERLLHWWAPQVALAVKNPPTNAGEVRHRFLLHYFAWRVPWTEDPGGLQSIGSQSAGHDWSDYHAGYPLNGNLFQVSSRLQLELVSTPWPLLLQSLWKPILR